MTKPLTNSIVATRTAIGLTCWLAPVVTSRLFCIDIRNDHSGKF